ncbi:MAG: hypothetical protein GY953_42285, partial [bacterium]|nr:hypothetical protein [bacterium]
EISHDLEKIVSRCLRKDLRRRFQHMDDIKIALEELKEESDSGKLLTAAVASQAAPRQRARGEKWGALALIVVAAVALAWWQWGRGPARVENLTAVPLTSYPGNEQTPALSPDGNQVAFSWDGEEQDNYDIYVQVVGAGEPLRLTDDPAFDWAPAWSPDGREILFYRYWREGKAAVVSIPPLGGRERTI